MMPGMNGDELAKHVKQVSPETPVILFSGKVRVYDQTTQADIFLPKGMYVPVELLEQIRLLLIAA
jgi:CheY-like chemotaxis protein